MYVHICIICIITYYIVILWFVISYFIHTHACAKNLRITVPGFFYGNEVSSFLRFISDAFMCSPHFAPPQNFRLTPKKRSPMAIKEVHDSRDGLFHGYFNGTPRRQILWMENKPNGYTCIIIILHNCIHVLFGNISFSCFSFWFRSCTLHWWMSDKAIIFHPRWCKQDFQLKETQKLRIFQHATPVLGVEIAHLRAVGVQLLESAHPHLGCRNWGNRNLHLQGAKS